MEYQLAKLVLETVASHGKAGCGIITLANQTQIEQSTLRPFLKSKKEFFCQLDGESKFVINSFGKYKGSLDEMNHALYRQYHGKSYENYVLVASAAFCLGYILGSN